MVCIMSYIIIDSIHYIIIITTIFGNYIESVSTSCHVLDIFCYIFDICVK